MVEEDRIQDGGARFTNVEQEYARQLLMADDRVRRLIEPLQGATSSTSCLTITPDPTNPLYGKRVVNVLINTPEGYLTELPSISVNLTDAAVVVIREAARTSQASAEGPSANEGWSWI